MWNRLYASVSATMSCPEQPGGAGSHRTQEDTGHRDVGSDVFQGMSSHLLRELPILSSVLRARRGYPSRDLASVLKPVFVVCGCLINKQSSFRESLIIRSVLFIASFVLEILSFTA